MWRKFLVTLKCPLLSELDFHYTLTEPVSDSCARGISADPLGNVLVRHHRWASCLANAVLAISIMCIKPNYLLFLNRHCLYQLWLEFVTKTHEFISIANGKNIDERRIFLEVAEEIKKEKGIVLLICITPLKMIAFSKLHCGSFLEVYLTY